MGETAPSTGFVPLVTVVGFHHARYVSFMAEERMSN